MVSNPQVWKPRLTEQNADGDSLEVRGTPPLVQPPQGAEQPVRGSDPSTAVFGAAMFVLGFGAAALISLFIFVSTFRQ